MPGPAVSELCLPHRCPWGHREQRQTEFRGRCALEGHLGIEETQCTPSLAWEWLAGYQLISPGCSFAYPFIHSFISPSAHFLRLPLSGPEQGSAQYSRVNSICPWLLPQPGGKVGNTQTGQSMLQQKTPEQGWVGEAWVLQSPGQVGTRPTWASQPWVKKELAKGPTWAVCRRAEGGGEGVRTGPAAMSHGCPRPCPWGS